MKKMLTALVLLTSTAYGQKFKSEYLDTSRVAVLKNDSLFVFIKHKEFLGLKQQGRQDTVILYNGKSYSFKYAVYDIGQFWVRSYSTNQVIKNKYENY